MFKIFKSKEQKKEFISTYQNPFQSDKIQKVEFVIEKSFWTNGLIKFKSCISFAVFDSSSAVTVFPISHLLFFYIIPQYVYNRKSKSDNSFIRVCR